MGTTATIFGKSSELVGGAGTAYQSPETELLDGQQQRLRRRHHLQRRLRGPLDATGASRHNTPGAGRQILNATQTVTRYTPNGSGGFTPQVVTPPPRDRHPELHLSDHDRDAGCHRHLPLRVSVRGSADLRHPESARRARRGRLPHRPRPRVALPGRRTAEGIGPFRGTATSRRPPSQSDMEALANGNSVLSDAPPSGVLAISANSAQSTTTRNQYRAVPALLPPGPHRPRRHRARHQR